MVINAKIGEIVSHQRAFFEKGESLNLSFRMDALQKLQMGLIENESEILDALLEDLCKTHIEGYMTEIGIVREDLRFAIRHLPGWVKPKPKRTPIAQFISKSYEVCSPYGLALVMSPWNYPIQLSLVPLIGSISAGNCTILKPSALAPKSSEALSKLIRKCFRPEYIAVVEGGREENQDLLAEKFDYIFFTGSASVGRHVMECASKTLTPVSLELGGKSPCIVDRTANLQVAAKRIAFGKLLNAGQTCVAPDYLLIERKVKDKFLPELFAAFDLSFPGKDYANLPKIVSNKHFQRLKGLMKSGRAVYGGEIDEASGRIMPTVIDDVETDDPIMKEEIFGPLLPVVTYDSEDEAVKFVSSRPHPLALYIFSEDRAAQRRFINTLSFGGGCINDTIIHLATTHMGFGGVGESGMGSYHGKRSFDSFSHTKSIVDKSTLIDLPMRYHPYNERKDKLIRLFIK
ncbi:MAG: aldehyde dehydrogenase [Clostridiales bacterium]|nr:aldehyde dehydrogenase [Clostridiales bacterium]